MEDCLYLVVGPTGDVGPTGPAGSSSASATGPQGPRGPTGDSNPGTGPTGPDGPTGPAGAGDIIGEAEGFAALWGPTGAAITNSFTNFTIGDTVGWSWSSGNFDTASGTYTAPAAGVYELNFTFVETEGNPLEISIAVNGTNIVTAQAGFPQSFSLTLELEAGNNVTVVGTSDGAVTASAFFSIVRLHETSAANYYFC